MRVGVFTALLAQLPLEEVLKKLKSLNISTVELGTGNYPGDPHCKLSMLDSKTELAEFKQKLSDYGVSISALSCHGNPLHPNRDIAKANQEVSRKTILLAAKLGVPVVIDFAGCPGDSDKAKYPNWVTCPWPPEYLDLLDWQWEKKVVPYWTKRAKFAEDHGVKIAIEMHPGFVAYSPETMLRLRSAAGKTIGVQLRSQPHVLAGHRSDRCHSRARQRDLPCARERYADLRAQPSDHWRARHQEVH